MSRSSCSASNKSLVEKLAKLFLQQHRIGQHLLLAFASSPLYKLCCSIPIYALLGSLSAIGNSISVSVWVSVVLGVGASPLSLSNFLTYLSFLVWLTCCAPARSEASAFLME